MIAEPGAFTDLRNVHVTGGRMEIRRGLYLSADAGAPFTDILAIAPLRAALQSVVVVYNEPTREVRLFRVVIDPGTMDVTMTLVAGVLWTIPITASFPVVSITDSYGKAFIAHNAPPFAMRQPTMVYDPLAGTFATLKYNEGANAIIFRGVARWLTYVVGWGYGTDDTGPPDDRNRPEIVRLSNPGDPEVFQPLFYFIAGQRGEPVIGCSVCTAGLLVAKEGELHLITGTSRLDFDIKLVDPSFGAVSERAMVEVRGDVYLWSAEGPRVSSGGPSVDLGLPLDLAGTVPDSVLAAADLRLCHGCYRPDREEIEWIFPVSGQGGAFSFTLDIKDPTKQVWSYRRYSRLIRCSGVLAGNVAFDAGDPAVAAYVLLTNVTPVVGSMFLHDVLFANINAANLQVGTVAEVWGYSAPFNPGAGAFDGTQPPPNDPLGWVKIGEAVAAGASQSLNGLMLGDLSSIPKPMEFRAFAVRYRLPDGSYSASSAYPNPFDWPLGQRGIVQGPSLHPQLLARRFIQSGGNTALFDASWEETEVPNLETGEEVEVWTLGSETAGVAGFPNGNWTQQLPNVAAGATGVKNAMTIDAGATGGIVRHVALRRVLPTVPGYDPRYPSANPWTWPAESRILIPNSGLRAVLASVVWVPGPPTTLSRITVNLPFNTTAPGFAFSVQIFERLFHIPSGTFTSGWFQRAGYGWPSGVTESTFTNDTSGNPGPDYRKDIAIRLVYVPGNIVAWNPENADINHPENWPQDSRISIMGF
jgi:hypothetical protein